MIFGVLALSYQEQGQGYEHVRINQSVNFVDPVIFGTTNHIDCLWKLAKKQKQMRKWNSSKFIGFTPH
uniref:Uncharacterized protein n=1 Tax=Octopus bimaculoides TaxID=37653 RepID=A0A0L8GMF5_OCTBM